ncbi:MAG: leucyl/phenylalanyl-tRNA--protein transferase [Ignavibacteria bacterium GWB2_35_12]|nr:MAG: leucyl/phenylalanyl-tRNA--protein transferase [Ignavibacteria bacterium GWA2_35_8]OGU39168.1 MAG: leucyl/phenylalanyl-tRNA--protein transferase [Ignavibacteria bacterium GWB2_35_12]OGU89196.1 MAG: leucyl/phenylalanyl-tRNA--protein transferase [Ignavibacteria bacterium RIFOXYA2_FULL_35_10]OGV21034.1 MAG: leucyl/phenylalanyl-tRNA--protein transferase [Ignavibacteria bacterium RIFOXYC2_FULL_35_21]
MREDALRTIIEPQFLINAYASGYFPMAESKESVILWHSPDPRAIIPLAQIKMPRSVRQSIKKEGFEIRIDTAFRKVIEACSQRDDTWISQEIIDSYVILHSAGYAHSVETYIDGKLVGGLYGVALGGAFFGESMFTTVSDASKAAFYHLANYLIENGFILLDTQFINEFTESLGAVEIPKAQYLNILKVAVKLPVKF